MVPRVYTILREPVPGAQGRVQRHCDRPQITQITHPDHAGNMGDLAGVRRSDHGHTETMSWRPPARSDGRARRRGREGHEGAWVRCRGAAALGPPVAGTPPRLLLRPQASRNAPPIAAAPSGLDENMPARGEGDAMARRRARRGHGGHGGTVPVRWAG